VHEVLKGSLCRLLHQEREWQRRGEIRCLVARRKTFGVAGPDVQAVGRCILIVSPRREARRKGTILGRIGLEIFRQGDAAGRISHKIAVAGRIQIKREMLPEHRLVSVAAPGECLPNREIVWMLCVESAYQSEPYGDDVRGVRLVDGDVVELAQREVIQ